jgi:hypothetical protein
MLKLVNPDIQSTIAFAKDNYAGKKTVTGGCLFEHCMAVAAQAELIAAKLYQDVRADYMSDDTKDSINVVIQSAILHDVLNVSACAFENVAKAATVQIAATVADLSRDFRLIETKRDMEFRGRLSQSPVNAQIIAVADVICTARDLMRWLEHDGLSVAAKIKSLLAQLDGDLLAVHAANKYYVLRLFTHAARNLISDVSTAVKAKKQKAKLDKLLAQNTKGLRERIARGQKEKKEKETTHAKKRSANKNS